MDNYWGHSENSFGRKEPLSEHLRETARYAALFGEQLGIRDESLFTALLHDLGKMGASYQRRLKGLEKHVDHWSFGAYAAKKFRRDDGWTAALAILGHHVGLGKISDGKNIDSDASCEPFDANLNLSLPESPAECDLFLKSLPIDPRTIPSGETLGGKKRLFRASVMADIRMLYSILVDADFLATEGHFRGTPEQPYYTRPEAPPFLPNEMFERLRQFMTKVKKNAVASENTISVRDDLMKYALAAAEGEIGNYTLTAPTGSGKTLAMLAFALKHAAKWNLKRIIVVIPFLSIIEQTAGIYRDALLGDEKRDFAAPFVLEDHSRARTFSSSNGEENGKESLQNFTAENWDAPVVITTNIQFFESLFSNRPGACRKLHRMANSVILFDEVQTMKKELAVPTLATLGELFERFHSTLVMATATQPAFGTLSDEVKKYANGWTPREIVGWNDPNPKESLRGLFDRARRTRVTVLGDDETVPWTEIAQRMVEKRRTLCIVNLKKHAQKLIDELTALLPREEGKTPVGLYHLSTSMCPAHRKKTLQTIREELKTPDTGQFTLLVATQCIEAGVDIDFPVLFRTFGPLDSIAQAMGRCNRNQLLEFGEVFLFKPESEIASDGKPNGALYPGGGYQRAAEVAINLIAKMRKKNKLDLENPRLYRDYFTDLYLLGGQVGQPVAPQTPSVLRGITGGDFREVAENYRLIEGDTINILVPYDREKFDELLTEAQKTGISGEWMTRARDLTVTYYRSSKAKLDGSLENLPLRDRTGKASEVFSDDWFYLLDPRNENDPRYDPLKGFCGETDNINIV